ncbi:MAG: hypothetical protein U0871_19455 [Gemmataceae bacterium]
MRRFRPQVLAVLGVTVARQAFDCPAVIGSAVSTMPGSTRVWVLLNPSGLNALYNHTMVDCFRELRVAVGSGRDG